MLKNKFSHFLLTDLIKTSDFKRNKLKIDVFKPVFVNEYFTHVEKPGKS